MITLAMIRHGETDWNHRGLIQGTTDVPLNEIGLAQASQAAEQLASHHSGKWASVVTSPLSRAFTTGQVIASALEIPVLDPMQELAERDYGAMEGVEMTRARQLHPEGDYPGSEHNDQVFARAFSAIETLRSTHPGAALVVVSHGGLTHTLLSRLHGERVESINNAAVNLLEHDGDRWKVRAINGAFLPQD